MKTYSRQRARVDSCYDTERPRKRIRMGETGGVIEETFGDYQEDEQIQDSVPDEAAVPTKDLIAPSSKAVTAVAPKSSSISAPSSPPARGRALFSSDPPREDESELSSVPSSPPPLPSPLPVARKPAFSFLKRKRPIFDDGSASEPLSDITANPRKVPRLSKKVTQMQIDLGGEVRKACRICGMEYIPSVKEDSALHRKFCAMDAGGVNMGKAFLKDDTVRRLQSEKTKRSEDEMVVTVDRKSSLAARNKTRKVLEVVNAELSSADIEDDRLWGALHPTEKRKGNSEETDRRGDRFKAFLYMVEDRCVGFCLAEKISNAFQVVSPGSGVERRVMTAAGSSSISTSTTADVALLGISRIWTSKSHRGRGVALDLLECGRMNFFYGVGAPKNLVAFSQPTESGGRLAERWFGAMSGWHVYRGDQ